MVSAVACYVLTILSPLRFQVFIKLLTVRLNVSSTVVIVIMIMIVVILLFVLMLVFGTVANVAAVRLRWHEILITLIVLIVGKWWLCVVCSVCRWSIHTDRCIEYGWWCDVNNVPCVAVFLLQFRIRCRGMKTIYIVCVSKCALVQE